MTLGPGKYDDILTTARERAGVTDERGGAAVLIIMNGKHGNGFSVQADARFTELLPDLLEEMAKQMREDTRQPG